MPLLARPGRTILLSLATSLALAGPAVAADTTDPETVINGGPAEGSIVKPQPKFWFHSNEAGAKFQCRLEGSGLWHDCTSGHQVPQQVDMEHTFEVRAVDAAGNWDHTPAKRTYTVDNYKPKVALTGGPADGARTNAATYTFTATDVNLTTVECRVGFAGPWEPCSGAGWTPKLPEGPSTISVRAYDAATWSTTVSRTVVMDTIAPDVTVTVDALSKNPSPTFSFSAPHDGGAAYKFECSLDGSVYFNCTNDLKVSEGMFTPAAMADGKHTMAVAGTDEAGNTTMFGAVVTVVVDTTAPKLAWLAAPEDGSTLAPGPITVHVDGGDAVTVSCAIDDKPIGPCDKPLTTEAPAPGSHSLEVWAVDAAGNGTGLERTFTVKASAADVAPAAVLPATTAGSATGSSAPAAQPPAATAPGTPAATPPVTGSAAPRVAAPAAKRKPRRAASCSRRALRKLKGAKLRKAKRACRAKARARARARARA